MKRDIAENIATKEKAIKDIDNYLTELLGKDDDEQAKAGKLSAWLEKFINFLRFENKFNPTGLKRYKRGEVVKVHLGYNIGSEEGGLHYCLIADKNNPQSSPVVTIIPLTSVKPDKDLSNLHPMEVYLGNELYTKMNTKNNTIVKKIEEEVTTLEEIIQNAQEEKSKEVDLKMVLDLKKRVNALKDQIALSKRIEKEILKMKKGSIALVNQIRTISKMRISDPKRNKDVLSGIRISDEKLDLIDREIIESFTNYSSKID
jgi:mRNA-degrading endonuclease toxin of MazEF toxin-antitoxin module